LDAQLGQVTLYRDELEQLSPPRDVRSLHLALVRDLAEMLSAGHAVLSVGGTPPDATSVALIATANVAQATVVKDCKALAGVAASNAITIDMRCAELVVPRRSD
jgi:hypothetical protein